jgi:hypothetical protein
MEMQPLQNLGQCSALRVFEKDLYCTTPAVTQVTSFFRSHPIERPIQSPYNTQGDVEDQPRSSCVPIIFKHSHNHKMFNMVNATAHITKIRDSTMI